MNLQKNQEINHQEIEVDWSIDQFANLTPALMWLSDTNGLATYLNQNWLNFVGRTMEQELGNGWADNVHPDDLEPGYKKYMAAIKQRQETDLEFRLKRHDGEYRWLLDHMVPRYSQPGKFLGFIGTCLDVTDLYKARQIIERQRDELALIAQRDHLTNAYNRRHLFDLAEKEIERRKRYQHQLYVLMIDVDNYKKVNDTFGHKVGDDALIALVKSFNEHIRSVDTICRYAGDEFCIILPETNLKGAQEIAKRLHAAVGKITLANAKNLSLTISIGLAEHQDTFMHVDDWLHAADTALYNAKQQGRNRTCIAAEDNSRITLAGMHLGNQDRLSDNEKKRY